MENNSNSFFRILKNLSAVSLGNIVGNAISALFWLYLASILSKEEYGELGFIFAIIATVSAFALLGSQNTLMVYVAKNVKIQATVFLLTLIAGFLSSIGLLVFTENIFISFYPLSIVIFSLVAFDFLGRKAFVNYAKYLIIQRSLMVILSLVFIEIWGINGIILGYTLSLGSFAILAYKAVNESKIDFRLLIKRKNFIINNFTTHILAVLSINIDKLIIFPVFGATISGPYQLGFQIFSMIMFLPHTVIHYTLPHDATGTKNLKLKKYTLICSAIVITLTIILSPILIPELFPKFVEAIEVIQIMSLGILPAAISLILTSELLGNERTSSVVIGVVIGIITLVVGVLVLGELWGLVGMSIALVLGKVLQCITLLILKNKNLKNIV